MPISNSADDQAFLRRAIDVSIRLGIAALLGFWCFAIVRPFIQPIVWGAVLAVAVYPLYRRLESALGDRSRLAASLFVVAALLLLIVPSVSLTASMIDTATALSHDLHEGTLKVPPPPTQVADWPVIGDEVHQFWATASQNLEAAARQIAPQLKEIGRWLIATGATTGMGLVKLVISILIAGVLLANAPRATQTVQGIATRLAHDRGGELTQLAAATVQSVTRGILGVALIQALLAGVGLLAVGVPAAGLWALLVLLLAVVQLTPLLVLGPITLYVFSTHSTGVAVAFAIWIGLVTISDSFLKPMLLGRGLDVPMLVIFMGAIGGFLLDGIIGLFVGAVLLALGYTLAKAWIDAAEPTADEGEAR